MKKITGLFLTALMVLNLTTGHTVQAAEIAVLRGEEEETELILTGTEDVYSMYGELMAATDYVRLGEAGESLTDLYQAMKVAPDGGSAKLLLSSTGEYPEQGLKLKLKVKGVRIGTGTIRLADAQFTDAEGEWLEGVELQPITVQVLPNPLVISLSGTTGNNGWYVSPVQVTVADKDAEHIWYDTGDGKADYTGPFELQNGSWLLTVTSDDGYGYIKEEAAGVRVDMVKPSFGVSAGELSWQQEPIEVTAGSSDNGSGIAAAYWAFSESPEQYESLNAFLVEEGASPNEVLSMETDGIWYLHLAAEDKAGNETEAVYGPYRKDSVKPEITFGNLYQEKLVEDGITPDITVEDGLSGIKKVTYLLDDEEWSLSEITGKGQHVLTVTAEDLAGNIHTESVTFSIYDSIQVDAMAEDTHYTGTASCSALVSYRGEPLEGAETEFFLNGESIGNGWTDSEGMVRIHLPVELDPQEAELRVTVSRDDGRFLLAAEDTCSFTIHPENAWLFYSGDYSVRNGDPFRVWLETGEFPDCRMGDITRAELKAELYKIEKDGSRTFTEEALLVPDERGVAAHEFYPETGLYELKVSFTEDSCYKGQEIVLHPAVYDIQAELEAEGGKLLLDLPHLGIYVRLVLTFLPPTVEAEVEVRIPGTGITLTENRITDYDLTTDGMVLYGTALNPEDGCTYSYEIRSGYSVGLLLDELEVSVWKGADKTAEPVYHFEWSMENIEETEE